jgi:hypothetical protein
VPMDNPKPLSSDDLMVIAHDAQKIAECRYRISLCAAFDTEKIKELTRELAKAEKLLIAHL